MPASNPMAGSPYRGTPLGYVKMTSFNSAAVALSSIPAGATYAILQAETATVRLTDDGTAPTSTKGLLLATGTIITYTGDLDAVQVIGTGSTSILHILYYR